MTSAHNNTAMTPFRLPGLVLALALLCASFVAVRAQTQLPECYSSTDEYIFKEFVLPVQPVTPVLIQRFEGRKLRLFCVMLEELGPDCGAANPPVLCHRGKDDISSAFTCEQLPEYLDDVNTNRERGSINGPNTIWLLQWDPNGRSPQCFPRSVRARVLAFVQGEKVASIWVFVVMLLIAIAATLLMVAGAVFFLRERYWKIDSAGATTIGGPKAAFQGPQLAVVEGGVARDQTRVYLPVRNEDGALADMQASRYGSLKAQQIERGAAVSASKSRGPARRASPPAPGDGIEDEMMRERLQQRHRAGRMRTTTDGDDDEFDPDSDGGGFQRRRHPRKNDRSRRGGGHGDEALRTPKRGSIFPTQADWETAAEGSIFDDEDDGSGGAGFAHGGGRSAAAPESFGHDLSHSVKYIPQWMQGSFGRGGMIPEVGDGDEASAERLRGQHFEVGERTMASRDPGSSGAKTFGRYQRRPQAAESEDKENASGRTPGGRKGPAGGGGGGGATPRSALKRRNVAGSARKGDGNDDDGTHGGYWSGGGGRGVRFHDERDGASGASSGKRGFNARVLREQQAESKDSFRRDSARLHHGTPGLRLDSPSIGGGSNGAVAVGGSSGAVATSMRCAACKMPLGTPSDAIYCPVTGDLHH